MKYILLTIGMGVLGVVGLIHAQPKRPAKPPVVVAPKPDPEEYWACGLGTRRDRSGDHCQCPMMVAEVRDEQIEKCYAGPPAQFDDCMKKSHDVGECDIVKNEDLKHPAHTCNRSCSTKAICRCHDGPRCVLPTFIHPSEGDDQQ